MPFRSDATNLGLGCPSGALLQASAFRGVAMGLAMSLTGTPVFGAQWKSGAWSLQNCDSIGARTVDVDIGMTPP